MNLIKILFMPFILFLSLTLAGQDLMKAATGAAALSEEALDRYEAFLDERINSDLLPGAVTLIYRHGEVGYFDARGYSEMGSQKPMTTDKLFYIQSMTKPIVSVAFMMLFEEGHFFLNDPVSKYIPEIDQLKVVKVTGQDEMGKPVIEYVDQETQIKMWHLLSHTAGFSHGLSQLEYDKILWQKLYETPHQTIEDRVGALISYPLMGQPGGQWNYSASPDILALLIEKISGKTCAEFLQERVFDPLGMEDTGYNVSDAAVSRVAGLHQRQEDGTLASIDPWGPPQGNTIYGGTHGLYSTASDYLKFCLMLLNDGTYNGHRYLGHKTLELMTDNFIEGLPYGAGNGFGLGFGMRTDVSDSAMPGSEGTFYWGGAFNTAFFVDQEEETIAIFMSQYWPSERFYSQKLRQFVYSALD